MTSEARAVSVVFGRIADLCIALGEHPLKQYEGCWTHAIDEHWWVAVNGHGEAKRAASMNGISKGDGVEVPPFAAYLEFNGWAAGFVGPYAGAMAAGKEANEDTLIAALEAAIRRAGGVPA